MWPQYILDGFARVPPTTTIENKYYGVYNHILGRECFNHPSFTVYPQYALPEVQTGGVPAIDFVVTYVVAVDDIPLLFLEIKPPGHIQSLSARSAADDQMRQRFRNLYHLSQTPRLHGISAMGQRLAFYSLDLATGDVAPPYIERSVTRVTDVAPAAWWDIDITTEEGFQRFMLVVQDVKDMAQQLHP